MRGMPSVRFAMPAAYGPYRGGVTPAFSDGLAYLPRPTHKSADRSRTPASAGIAAETQRFRTHRTARIGVDLSRRGREARAAVALSLSVRSVGVPVAGLGFGPQRD